MKCCLMLLDFEDEGMLCDLFHVLFDSIKCDPSKFPSAPAELECVWSRLPIAGALLRSSAVTDRGTCMAQPGERGAGEDTNAGGVFLHPSASLVHTMSAHSHLVCVEPRVPGLSQVPVGSSC